RVIRTGAKHRRAKRSDETAVTDRHVTGHAAVQHTVGTVGRPHGHRGSTVFLHRRADLRSDLVDGVVPTDALPLARAALATLDATQRVLQTVRIVDALRLGVALHAETAARRVVAR